MSIGTSQDIKPVIIESSGTSPISKTTTADTYFKLNSVTCHFNEAPTTSENFVVKLDAKSGAAYDTILYSVDPSSASKKDIVYIPDAELLFTDGDQIVVTYTNTDAKTFGLRVVYDLV